MSRTFFIRPDGKLVSVPSENANDALSRGYKAATDVQVEASQSSMRAGVEAAARVATMGLSDKLLVGLGADRGEMATRQEMNPTASTVGELVGSLIPGLFTEGGATAAVAAKAGVMQAAKRAAVQGAGLGLLQGAGTLVSETTLHPDHELTAEKLAASTLLPALAGGVLGGGVAAAGAGVSKLLTKVASPEASAALRRAGEQMEERTLSEAQKDRLARLERAGGSIEDVRDVGEKYGVLGTGASFSDETVAKAAAAREGIWNQQMAPALADLNKSMQLDPLRRDKLVNDVLQKLDAKYTSNPVMQQEIGAVKRELDHLILASPADEWEKVWNVQREFRKRAGPTPSPGFKEALGDARRILRDEILDADTSGVLRQANKDYAAARVLDDMIQDRTTGLAAIGGPTKIGVMDILRGGGLGGAIGSATGIPGAGALGAVVGGLANRELRERGGFIAGAALRKLADSGVLKDVAGALHTRVGQMMSLAPAALGPFRQAIADAYAQGPEALAQVHEQLASGPQGGHYLATMGMEPDDAGVHGRLAAAVSIREVEAAHDAQMDKAIDGILGARPGRQARIKSFGVKDYEKRIQVAQDALQNPESVFAQMPEDLRNASPGVANQAAATILRREQFLLSKAPRNPLEVAPEAIQRPWKPDEATLSKWGRYVEAAENPHALLERVRQGTASKEGIEVFQAVFPKLYADFQQKLGEKLAQWDKPLTYQQRMAVQPFMQPGAIPLPSEGNRQVIQQVYMEQAMKQASQQQGGGGMKPPDRRQKVSQQDNMETQAQRLENRGAKS